MLDIFNSKNLRYSYKIAGLTIPFPRRGFRQEVAKHEPDEQRRDQHAAPEERTGDGLRARQPGEEIAQGRFDGSSLAGAGNRMVVANAAGDLITQAIPTGDNLGNHTATIRCYISTTIAL